MPTKIILIKIAIPYLSPLGSKASRAKVIIDGEPYSIQWPTKSFDTFERSIYSEEQVQVGGDNNPLDEDSSE